jgi:hypothetical protein
VEESPLPFEVPPHIPPTTPPPSDVEDGRARSPLQPDPTDGLRDRGPGLGGCQRGFGAPLDSKFPTVWRQFLNEPCDAALKQRVQQDLSPAHDTKAD